MRYDPIKRHEYYIRTRQLKGRKPNGPKNKNWANDLSFSAGKGIQKIQARNASDAGKKEKILKLEDNMAFAGALRKQLRGTGKLDPDLQKLLDDQGITREQMDTKLHKQQYLDIAEYFGIKDLSGSGAHQSVDRYGNVVYVPAGVTQKMFLEFITTARNDVIPNVKLQNPFKKVDLKKLNIDLQSPLKKGKDPTYKVGVDPTGKSAQKAPVDYKTSKPAPLPKWPFQTAKPVTDKRKGR